VERKKAIQTATNPLDDLLEMHDFCEQLKICPRTAKHWHTLRTGPLRIRIGQKVYYKKSSVAEWLKRQEEAETRKVLA
jgi:hypothetical protein